MPIEDRLQSTFNYDVCKKNRDYFFQPQNNGSAFPLILLASIYKWLFEFFDKKQC